MFRINVAGSLSPLLIFFL